MMEQNLYLNNKTMYLNLVNQKQIQDNSNSMNGGGMWNYWSNDNDRTQETLQTLGIKELDDSGNQMTYHTSGKILIQGLKKLFNELEENVKLLIKSNTNTNAKSDKNKKWQIDSSPYNLNHSFLGVIIDMLSNGCEIPDEYLKRSLIHAYREYFRLSVIKEASGWKSYKDRLKCLRYEILLINIAINQGTPLKTGIDIIKFVNQTDPKYLIDNIYLKYKKENPLYKFNKYEILPLLDPKILDPGTIMQGYNGRHILEYYVVKITNKNDHSWKRFDPFTDLSTQFVDINLLYDIYGDDVINRLNKNDIRNFKKNRTKNN